MNATLAEMSIQAADIIVLIVQFFQIAEVGADLIWRHSGILPAFPILLLTWNVSTGAQARFAHLPDSFLFACVGEESHVRNARIGFQAAHEPAGLFFALLQGV